MTKVKVVFATGTYSDTQWAFGNGDKLPWPKIQEDFEWFKESTKDAFVVMGAKTWMSLPKSLKGRTSVVVCSPDTPIPCNKAGEFPDSRIVAVDYRDVIAELIVLRDKNLGRDICIIGGTQLIAHSLIHPDFVDEVHHTRIRKSEGAFDANITFSRKFIKSELKAFDLHNLLRMNGDYLSDESLHSQIDSIEQRIYKRKRK